MDMTIVRKVLRDCFRIDRESFPKCDVLTFGCDNDRYIRLHGKAYSPLINTIEDDLAHRGLTATSITRIASTIKGDGSHGRVYSSEGRFARALVSKRIKRALMRGRGYPFSHVELRIWKDILDQTQPKVVIGINPSRELCSLCHERGIWVADIQHGVISHSHHWYGAVFRASDPVEWLPDSFLVWDRATADVLEAWTRAKGVAVDVIGNPWVARFRSPDPEDPVYNAMVEAYPRRDNGRPNALLSLTWNSYGIPNGHVLPSVERFVLDTLDRYNWSFRLHPNQLCGFATHEGRDFFDYFRRTYPEGKVEWKQASEMPLPLLLSRTNLHTTWASSVCMEAAYFGIRTLLTARELLPGGRMEDYYEALVANGYADKIEPEYENVAAWFDKNEGVRMPPLEDHSAAYDALLDTLARRAKA